MSRRIGLHRDLAFMIEFAGCFEQQPRLTTFHQPRHPRKRIAILPHRFLLGRTLDTSRIAQDELTVLRIATGLVAFHAIARPNLRPHIANEELIHRRRATRVRLRFNTSRAARSGQPRKKCDREWWEETSNHESNSRWNTDSSERRRHGLIRLRPLPFQINRSQSAPGHAESPERAPRLPPCINGAHFRILAA